jgi:hypothetical protein
VAVVESTWHIQRSALVEVAQPVHQVVPDRPEVRWRATEQPILVAVVVDLVLTIPRLLAMELQVSVALV